MGEYGVDDVMAVSKDISHRFACSASIETDAPTGRPCQSCAEEGKGRADIRGTSIGGVDGVADRRRNVDEPRGCQRGRINSAE